MAAAREEGPARGEVAAQKLDHEHRQMLRDLEGVGHAFRRLHLPRRTVDETCPIRGGPEQELVSYHAATAPLRSVLAAPAEHLPSLESAEPFVLEMLKTENGELKTRMVVIDVAVY